MQLVAHTRLERARVLAPAQGRVGGGDEDLGVDRVDGGHKNGPTVHTSHARVALAVVAGSTACGKLRTDTLLQKRAHKGGVGGDSEVGDVGGVGESSRNMAREEETIEVTLQGVSELEALGGGKEELVRQASIVRDAYGFVFLQVFNGDFVPFVRSWICQARRLQHLLEQVVFVATDAAAEEALRDMGAPNVVHVSFASTGLVYGARKYFEVITRH